MPRLLLVFSAALYVGCSPAGNEETGSSDAGPPPPLVFTPGPDLKRLTITADPARVPDVSFTDARGDERQLSDFRGQAMVLNFWATWCAPCIHEMPSLDRLEQTKGGDDFVVLVMSNDRAGANVVDPFFEEVGLTALDKYYDPRSELARAMGVTGLPTTIVIDANGYERARLQGPAEWDSQDAKALVSAVLGK